MASSGRILHRDVQKILRAYNSWRGAEISEPVKYREIKYLITEMEKSENSSKKIFHQEMNQEIFTIKLIISSLALLSLRVYPEKGVKGILPRDWVNNRGRPNPNRVLSLILTQINNYALGVVRLVQAGLDTPARALLRSTIDLTWQTLVILNDRDDFSVYVGGNDFERGEDAWRRLFSRGRLLRKLNKVEETFKFIKFSSKSHERRKGIYKDHSHAIHTSYVAIGIGAYTIDLKSKRVSLPLFGHASLSSIRTLKDLGWELWYFQMMLIYTLEKKFQYTINLKKEPERWIDAYIFLSTAFVRENFVSD